MTDAEQDEAFEAYLRRRQLLPTAHDDRLEPSAKLDDLVLGRAREAIQARGAPDPAKSQATRPPRWAVPVALAATLLLCLSVVMNISLNTSRRSAESTRVAAASYNAPRESISGDIPSHEVILPEAKIAGPVAPHAPVVAQSVPADAPVVAQSAPADGSAQTSALADARAPASVRQDAAAPQPNGDSPPVGRSAFDKAQDFAKRAGVAYPAAKAGAAAPGPHPSDPKLWLQQIDALRTAGDGSRADAEMRLFRAAFPDYANKTQASDATALPK